MHGINSIAACIPLRSSSKLLKGTPSERIAAVKAFAEIKEGVAPTTTKPAPTAPKSEQIDVKIGQPNLATSSTGIVIWDQDEQSLYNAFQADLHRLRDAKVDRATTSDATSQGHGPCSIERQSDGTLVLHPRKTATDVKPEEPSSVVVKPDIDEPHKAKDIQPTDLDPYTQAALKALQTRADKKGRSES